MPERPPFASATADPMQVARHAPPWAGAERWLSLAAAPVFAGMALLAIDDAGTPTALCSAPHGGSVLSGMAPMYVVMSALHAAPWLRLAMERRNARAGT
jgi:hypothetical protein